MPSQASENRDRAEAELCALVGELAFWPEIYAKVAYPWGMAGTELEGFTGLDTWQRGFMIEWGEEMRRRKFDGVHPVEPIRTSVVSGRGIGKTAEIGMIADFITSCWPLSKGIVTANTGPQLYTKTWPEIVKWKRLGLTPHWFKINSGSGSLRIAHLQRPEQWRLDGYNWEEKKPDSFSGQHAITSIGYYLFDEASGIPRSIIETSEAGMTDGMPMGFLFGNGARNSGSFYESHNLQRERYHIRLKIDSRQSRFVNKEEIEREIQRKGIDSDNIKINVLGDFPNQSQAQFIPTGVVEEAMARPDVSPLITDPIVIGCDVAWEGDDASVIRIRQGLDARSRRPEIYRKRDPMFLAGRLAELSKQLVPDAIFVDMTGIGAGVVARLQQLGIMCIGIHNGGNSPDPTYHRQGDYMWGKMLAWMEAGGVIEQDSDLKSELTAREFSYDNRNAYVLESKKDLKKRGEHSPDSADGLALTFAQPVGQRPRRRVEMQFRDPHARPLHDYDPLERV